LIFVNFYNHAQHSPLQYSLLNTQSFVALNQQLPSANRLLPFSIHQRMEEHSLLNHPSFRRSNFQHFHCDISNFNYDISNFHCFEMTICWIVIISNYKLNVSDELRYFIIDSFTQKNPLIEVPREEWPTMHKRSI